MNKEWKAPDMTYLDVRFTRDDEDDDGTNLHDESKRGGGYDKDCHSKHNKG